MNESKLKISYHIFNKNIIYKKRSYLLADLWEFFRFIKKMINDKSDAVKILSETKTIDKSVYHDNYQLIRMPFCIKTNHLHSLKKIIYPLNLSFLKQLYIPDYNGLPEKISTKQFLHQPNNTVYSVKKSIIIKKYSTYYVSNKSFSIFNFAKCDHSIKFFECNFSLFNSIQWNSITCIELNCSFKYIQQGINCNLKYPSCFANIPFFILSLHQLKCIEDYIVNSLQVIFHPKLVWLIPDSFKKNPSKRLKYSINLQNIKCIKCHKSFIKLQKTYWNRFFMWCCNCNCNLK